MQFAVGDHVTPWGDDGRPYPYNWMTADESIYRHHRFSGVQAGDTVKWVRRMYYAKENTTTYFRIMDEPADWAERFQHTPDKPGWGDGPTWPERRGLCAVIIDATEDATHVWDDTLL